MTTIHKLKTWTPIWEHVNEGRKTFEVRKNDRGYCIGDILQLDEWDPITESYTGRKCFRQVNYILSGGTFGVSVGYCVMGLVLLEDE